MAPGKSLNTLSDLSTVEVFEELRRQSEQLWRESDQLRHEALWVRLRSEELRRGLLCGGE